MQRNVSSFAGGRARRPSRRAAQKRGRVRRACGCPQCERHLRRRRLQPPVKTVLRQEVPEPIGLGKSSHRERSRVGGALRRFNHESLWPVTSRLAVLRKGLGHPPSQSCDGGDSGAVGGVRSIEQLCSQFVSIADVAKRRAVLTATGEEPVTTAEGLAPPCESKAGSERAPEAGPQPQAASR